MTFIFELVVKRASLQTSEKHEKTNYKENITDKIFKFTINEYYDHKIVQVNNINYYIILISDNI